jgi:hypothetical protein
VVLRYCLKSLFEKRTNFGYVGAKETDTAETSGEDTAEKEGLMKEQKYDITPIINAVIALAAALIRRLCGLGSRRRRSTGHGAALRG